MITETLRRATPKLAIAAAVAGALYDLPHFLFDENGAVASDHPLFVIHSIAGIVMCVLLSLVAASILLRVQSESESVLSSAAGATTLLGLFLVAGGIWGEGFVVPFVADVEPSVFDQDPGGLLLAAIIIGGVVFAVGWLLMSVLVHRAGLLSHNLAIVLGIASVAVMAPFPGLVLAFTAILAAVTTRSFARASEPDFALDIVLQGR